MTKHVVWDWNGTLLDDVDCCVDVVNQLLGEYDLPPVDGIGGYQAVFRFPIVDYYAELGFDTSAEGNFAAAAHRYLELYGAASARCGLHDGAQDVLRTLHEAGTRQVVISASEQGNLLAQLAPFGLEAWLDGAHGIADIYAASKQALAHRWLSGAGADPTAVWFVGDSEHDFEIADALGSHCILFSGGHHARSHLETLGVPVVDDLREVPALVRAG